MLRRLAPLALTLSIAVAVAGCSAGPRVDATSGEALARSLQKYLSSAVSTKPADRKKAVETIKRFYLVGGKLNSKLAPDIPPVEALDRLYFEDLAAFAKRVESWSQGGRKAATLPPVPESAIERRWRNQYIVDQLGAQHAMLSAKRDKARYKELFTVDQFKFTDSSFIPPQEGVELGKDGAMFTTKFENGAVFSVYKIGFHITVRDPSLKAPLVDDVYYYEAGKEPIQLGESRDIAVTCCDSFTNQTINLALRQLPADAQIEMDLVEVYDHSKKNRLESASFTSADGLKLAATEACLADIKSRLDAWTPETAAPACQKY